MLLNTHYTHIVFAALKFPLKLVCHILSTIMDELQLFSSCKYFWHFHYQLSVTKVILWWSSSDSSSSSSMYLGFLEESDENICLPAIFKGEALLLAIIYVLHSNLATKFFVSQARPHDQIAFRLLIWGHVITGFHGGLMHFPVLNTLGHTNKIHPA